MAAATRAVLANQPRVARALDTARGLAASQNDPELLAIAERRICELLGVELPAQPAVAGATSTDVGQAALGRAALVFVEQWVIDVANITDDMVSALRSELGEDRLMDFVHGVLAIEQRIRLALAWDRLGLT